jgi:hypothetical protein
MGTYGETVYGPEGPSSSLGLSACDLDAMKDTVVGTLDRTATILRESRASDGAGGQMVTFPEIATDVPCRIVRSDLRYVQTGDRVTTITDTRLILPRNAEVQMGDKLVIDGYEFRVEALPFMDMANLTCSVSLWRP